MFPFLEKVARYAMGYHGWNPANPRCAFCGRSYRTAGPFIEGESSAFICAACLRRAQKTHSESRSFDTPRPATSDSCKPEAATDLAPYAPPSDLPPRECSFCGDSAEWPKVFATPKGENICRRCADFSLQILQNARRTSGLP